MSPWSQRDLVESSSCTRRRSPLAARGCGSAWGLNEEPFAGQRHLGIWRGVGLRRPSPASEIMAWLNLRKRNQPLLMLPQPRLWADERIPRLERPLLAEPGHLQFSKVPRPRDFSLLAFGPSPTRSGGAPSAGQDGAQLYPGPLCGGEVGTTGKQGSRQGGRLLFARTGVRSKTPAPAHGLAGQGCPASAKQGGLLCWLLIFTPGILPSALRAGFAVRARSGRARGHARDK
jgi:hypothetical protein